MQSQQEYMCSFNQKDVVSEAFLENAPDRTSPRVLPGDVCPAPVSPEEPGSLTCTDGPFSWNHSR